MGSPASGDTYQRRTRIEECLKLTISGLRALGHLESEICREAWFAWGDLLTARFKLEISSPEAGEICLDYEWANHKVHQRIPLVSFKQHFGGVRWWFRCPLTDRRTSTLYLPPGARGFASRQAYGLSPLKRFARLRPKQSPRRQLCLFHLDR